MLRSWLTSTLCSSLLFFLTKAKSIIWNISHLTIYLSAYTYLQIEPHHSLFPLLPPPAEIHMIAGHEELYAN